MQRKDQIKTVQATLDEGETAASRFKDFVKQIVSVPKEEIDKREAQYQKQKAKKQKTKKP